MSKHSTENSPLQPVEQKTPSTLPPNRRTYDSGKFRFSIRKTITNPAQLLDPTIGGMLLREQPSWETLAPEIKKAIQPGMLEFIAQEPIPTDQEINAEIITRSNITAKQLAVKKALYDYCQLPEVIIVALRAQLEQEIAQNPKLDLSNLLAETQILAQNALSQIRQTSYPEKTSSSKYCLIAHDILASRQSQQHHPPLLNLADEDCETKPETPCAKKKST